MKATVPILMFHHIARDRGSRPNSSLFVSLDKLGEIAVWLLKRKMSSITVAELGARLRNEGGRRSLAGKFVLTFDDGARNNYDLAYPLLNELGLTATFFVPTDYIGKRSGWSKHRAPFDVMSQEQIERLCSAGFEIGSHGCRHRRLTSLSDSELAAEATKSKSVLERITGESVQSFAYPYGCFNQRVVERIAAAGYRCACSTIKGAVQDARRLFALKRIMVTEQVTALRFRWWLSGLMDLEHRHISYQRAENLFCKTR